MLVSISCQSKIKGKYDFSNDSRKIFLQILVFQDKSIHLIKHTLLSLFKKAFKLHSIFSSTTPSVHQIK
ncbi:MAG: hypothetical protein LBQ24_05480 [Candidatus Peribacteria bacterium]|nr:hypothetical protein [Candidatus Peribacteria bacterium]